MLLLVTSKDDMFFFVCFFFIFFYFYFYFYFYFFYFLFMAVLGLHFCPRAFSSCDKWGPLFITVRGPLTIAASLVAEHRLQTRRLSNFWLTGPAAPRHVGSSQTRARTRVLCIGRQILNHCATREARYLFLICLITECLSISWYYNIENPVMLLNIPFLIRAKIITIKNIIPPLNRR